MSEKQKTKNQHKAVKLEQDKSLTCIQSREDDDTLITNTHPWRTKSFEELRKEVTLHNKRMIKRSKEFKSNKVYRARSVGAEFVAKCQDSNADPAQQKFESKDVNGKQTFKSRLNELGNKFNEKSNKGNEEKNDKAPIIKNTNKIKCTNISNPVKPSCNFFDKWKRMKKLKYPLIQQNNKMDGTFWESLSNKSLKTIIHLQDPDNLIVNTPKVNLGSNDLESQESEYSECTETSTCNVHDKKIGLEPILLEEIAPYILGFTKCFLNDFRNFLLTGYKKLDKISLQQFELMVKAVESFPTNDIKFNTKTLDKGNYFNNIQNSNAILPEKNNKDKNNNKEIVSDNFPEKDISPPTNIKSHNIKCNCKNSYGNQLLNYASAKEFQDLYNKHYPFPVKLYKSVMVQTNTFNESLIKNG